MLAQLRFFLTILACIFLFCFSAGCAALFDGFARPADTGSFSAEDRSNTLAPQQPQHDSSYVYMQNPNEGSLWTPYNSRSFLFGDNKARNINDIVTVNIVESADASRNATTKLDRKGGIKSDITKFFGSPDLTFGMGNLWGKNTKGQTAATRVDQPFQPELETETENSFNGSGSTVRKDKFISTISARVCEIYPNGNMLIKGNREVTINSEKQFINLSGIIRPEDVSSDNVVLSTAIADAKISISGKGVITDKQAPGFGHRFFDYVWPF